MFLGLLRERLLVARFYSCCRYSLDAYFAAFRLPDMVFQLVVIGALSAAFIPVFSEKLQENEKEAYRLASALINLLLAFFLIVGIFIFIFAHPFSGMITGNFSPEQISLMANMTRLMLFAQLFFLVSNFFAAMIQSHQRFLLPALSPIVYNLGIIVSVFFFSSRFGIWSAAYGVLFGSILHLLIQVPLVIKLGFRYSLIFDVFSPGVRKVAKLMVPRTLALAISQIEATVSLFLATSLSPGSLTLFYLAQKLADLPVRFVGTSVGQAALPLFSLQVARKENDAFKASLLKSLNQVLFLSLPATAVFLVLRIQFVRFAYGAREFPWGATLATGYTMAAISLSVFTQSAIQILVRAFYAVHDTVAPFIIGLLSVSLNIALSCLTIFVFKWGIFGLALSFSVSNLLNFLLLLIMFNHRWEKIISRKELFLWFKMICLSVFCGIGSWISLRVLDTYVFQTDRTIPLLFLTLISVVVGVIIYFGLAYFLKLKELTDLTGSFGRIKLFKKKLPVVEEVVETF